MMRKTLLISLVAGIATGCVPMPGPADQQEARLRVIHASPDAPSVDICANGAVAFPAVAFSSATAYARLAPATYAIRVVGQAAGCESDAVISAELPLAAGQDVSVVALNLLATIEPLVLIDDNSPPPAGTAKVRFVHASPDAPAVDVTLPDGTTLFDNISFKQTSAYLEVDAASYDLEVRDETGTSVVLTLDGITLSSGRVYTVFAVGLLSGDPPLNALITTDY